MSKLNIKRLFIYLLFGSGNPNGDQSFPPTFGVYDFVRETSHWESVRVREGRSRNKDSKIARWLRPCSLTRAFFWPCFGLYSDCEPWWDLFCIVLCRLFTYLLCKCLLCLLYISNFVSDSYSCYMSLFRANICLYYVNVINIGWLLFFLYFFAMEVKDISRCWKNNY